jgi:chromosome segregation ATPase
MDIKELESEITKGHARFGLLKLQIEELEAEVVKVKDYLKSLVSSHREASKSQSGANMEASSSANAQPAPTGADKT